MVFKTLSRKSGFKAMLSNIAIITFFLTAATGLAWVFDAYKIEEANIIMVYMLAVTAIAYFSLGFFPSIVTSISAVLLFNFYFTEPRFTFTFIKTSYAFTFAFMFISAMMMSVMTNKMQGAMLLAKSRERRTQLLYQVSQRLIRIERVEDVALVIGEECSEILHRRIIVALTEQDQGLTRHLYFQKGKLVQHFTPLASHHFASMNDVFSRHLSELVTAKFKGDAHVFYVPVIGKRTTYGVIGFILKEDEKIDDEQRELGLAIAAMMANTFEYYQRS